MKIKPTNNKLVKTTKMTGIVYSVIQEITAQFPSMTANEAQICALNVCSQISKKKRGARVRNKLAREAVANLAKDIVINDGGLTFIGGRVDAMAQALLTKWSVPNNTVEVAQFQKLLKYGCKAWEKADELLAEPIKKAGSKTKP